MPTLRNTTAGREEWVKQWVVAAGCYTKVKCLLNHMESLQRRGLVALSDQLAAARRTWQEVNSSGVLPESRKSMETEARVKCWRDKKAEQGQMQLTLRSLRKALDNTRKEVDNRRLQALHNLARRRFCEVESRLRVLSGRMRRKEKGRLREKIINLEKRDKNCQKHQICRWVRRYKR